MVLTLEGCFSSDKLVDSDSNWPQVDFFIIASTSENLRCQVKIRPYYGQHISPLSSLEGFFADTKVNDLQSFYQGVIENIFWFDITMTDISLMQIGNGLQYLSEYDLHFWLIFDIEFK